MTGQRQTTLRDGLWYALSFLKHGRLIVLLFCLALTAGLVFYVYARALYQSRALVRYELFDLPLLRQDGREGALDVRMDQARLDLRESLASNHMVERTALRLGVTKSMGNYESLRDGVVPKVEVAIVDGTTLRVDVQSYDPKLVSKWQVAMVEEFKEYAHERRRQQREERTRIFQEELDSLARRIDQEQREKLSFEEENSITELFVKQAGLTQVPQEMIQTQHRLSQMDQMRKSLEAGNFGVAEQLGMLSGFETKLDLATEPTLPVPEPGKAGASLENLVPRSAERNTSVVLMPSATGDSESWKSLSSERQELLEKVREAQKTYLPGHQKMRELQAQLDRVEDSLDAELKVAKSRFETEYSRLATRLAALEAQLPDYREINKKHQEFRRTFQLQQNRNLAWADAHAALAKRIAVMEHLGDDIPVRLEFLEYNMLRDRDPVSPPKMKLFMMSLALGLALGVAVPFGLEKMDDSITRLDDAEITLNLEGLGVVPVYDRAELENVIRPTEDEAEKPDRLLEDFRIIRSSIALNRDMAIPTQAIMVTSARPGEGKSTIATNLAWAFASMGEKTLLVDCDLRRGRLHRVLNADNAVGLTSVLVGSLDWRASIQSAGIENLDVLVRGAITPGATERLCKLEFANLMDEWRNQYQRIIVDTPPVLGLSEASSLQRVVDGTVLVILSEQTPKRDVKQALDMLKKSGGRMYGFVLNRLDLKKAANYYHYSYYSPYYYEALQDASS